MSKAIGQPIGQKRLTNVAIVRLKSHGVRFEIACYKNKVLSWRSGVEKDLDEVLQSQTVYTNVSKGIVAKSKDLMAAFGTDNHSKISLEILNKGELQVAGKERESQLTSQFRDIATIVMEKTINPETQHPYTISMIERLMHEIHYAVDPNSSSKKQALEVIRELQKQFPIKRSPMRLRLLVPEQHADALMDMLNTWEAHIHSKDMSMCHLSVVCQLDPGLFRQCDSTVRNFQGQLEILDVSLHADQNILAFQGEDHEPAPTSLQINSEKTVTPLIDEFSKQVSISKEAVGSDQQEKSKKCSTCDALVGNAKEYREHCKTTWHTQNVKRRAMKLLPITMEESNLENEMGQYKDDLKDYSF